MCAAAAAEAAAEREERERQLQGEKFALQHQLARVQQQLSAQGREAAAASARVKEVFGEIERCEPPGKSISLYQVKFKSHAAAEKAAVKAPKVEGLFDNAFVAYKSVPYDDLDSGGDGRGW